MFHNYFMWPLLRKSCGWWLFFLFAVRYIVSLIPTHNCPIVLSMFLLVFMWSLMQVIPVSSSKLFLNWTVSAWNLEILEYFLHYRQEGDKAWSYHQVIKMSSSRYLIYTIYILSPGNDYLYTYFNQVIEICYHQVIIISITGTDNEYYFHQTPFPAIQ